MRRGAVNVQCAESDEEGVLVIPTEMAAQVAEAAVENELLDSFLMEKLRAGAPLAGTFPPNERTRAEFAEWRKEQGL